MASNTPCSCGCGDTVKTCRCPETCSCRKQGGSCYAEKSAALGLWDRIRAKRERGGTPAKPGDKDYPDGKSWKKVTGLSKKKTEKEAGTPAWQKTEGKNDEGGLNAKGRASYNKATGGNLKAPVTESNPKGKRAKRQNSFCSRMCGMKKHETGAKTKKDPDSRINKSLRKWNCKCASAFEFGKLAAKNWIGREDNSFDGMHVTKSTVPSIEGAVKSLTGVTLPFVDMTSGRGLAPLANNAAVALEGIGSRVGDTFKNLPTPQAFGGAPAQGPMPQQKSGAQAVPPAVANDLGRSSLINVTSDFNDRSQAAALLGALFPTAVGGVAGALSSRKGKRLAGAARGAGIGAAYTVGSGAGSLLGGLASGGNSLAQLGGGLGGGVGSALLAANLLPEINEEKQSMANPYTFGAKMAAEPTFLQSYGNVMDRWYNPNSTQQITERGEQGLRRAGQAGLGVAGLAGGFALGPAAAAATGPLAAGMTNLPMAAAAGAGYGSLLRAVTPEQQPGPVKPDNLMKVLNPQLRNPGAGAAQAAAPEQPSTPPMGKSSNAIEFGAKLAQSMCSPCDMPNGPTNKKHMTGASPAVLEADEKSEELGRPESEETEHSEKAIDIPGKAAAFGAKLAANYGGVLQHSNQFDSANKDLQLVNPATGFSQDDKMTFPYDGPTPGSILNKLKGYGSAALSGLDSARQTVGKAIGETVGPLTVAPVSAWTGPSSPKPAAPKPAAAPTNLYDALVNVAKSDVTGKDLPAAISQVSPPDSPSLLSQIAGSPYTPYVAGGLGATGLAALAYHLMNQKPKKKREEERGEDKE